MHACMHMYVLEEVPLTACDVGEGGLDAEPAVQLGPCRPARLCRLALAGQVLHTAGNTRPQGYV